MNVQLSILQLWALAAGGPVAMILTVLVGILINNAVTKAHVDRIEGTLRSDIQRIEGTLRSEIQTLRAEMQRVEGVLTAKLDALTQRVKAIEDQIDSPLVRK